MAVKHTTQQSPKQRGGKCNVVVVCHANVYRSPLVTGLLKCYLPSIEIKGRGVRPDATTFNKPAAKKIRDFAASYKYGDGVKEVSKYLASHRSTQVALTDLRWADVVVYMDNGNLAHLQKFNVSHSKFLPLGRFAIPQVDRIVDPAFLRSGTPELQSLLLSIVTASLNLAGYLREHWLL